jgi:hypothetical protein
MEKCLRLPIVRMNEKTWFINLVKKFIVHFSYIFRSFIITFRFAIKYGILSFKFGTAVPSWSCSKVVYRPVWHIPLPSVQWVDSWWWTDELSETCRVSWQNKCVKLVHLFGFITKKFVRMHGHMNVKLFSGACYEYWMWEDRWIRGHHLAKCRSRSSLEKMYWSQH